MTIMKTHVRLFLFIYFMTRNFEIVSNQASLPYFRRFPDNNNDENAVDVFVENARKLFNTNEKMPLDEKRTFDASIKTKKELQTKDDYDFTKVKFITTAPLNKYYQNLLESINNEITTIDNYLRNLKNEHFIKHKNIPFFTTPKDPSQYHKKDLDEVATPLNKNDHNLLKSSSNEITTIGNNIRNLRNEHFIKHKNVPFFTTQKDPSQYYKKYLDEVVKSELENLLKKAVYDEKFNKKEKFKKNEKFKKHKKVSLFTTRKYQSQYHKKDFDEVEKNELENLLKRAVYIERFKKIEPELVENKETITNEVDKRSCIFCNNVLNDVCNKPQNQIIQSTFCENSDDLCYSLHTPFGIVDRGCFNSNKDMITYVCSCNLCNDISISNLPVIFANKKEWVENVKELSKTKHLRKSVFKDLECLSCETNTFAKFNSEDALDMSDCFEGTLDTLSIEDCEKDEVCGIKAIKSQGYIWRGCLKKPRYNYYMKLCDDDLCNYDPTASVFDVL